MTTDESISLFQALPERFRPNHDDAEMGRDRGGAGMEICHGRQSVPQKEHDNPSHCVSCLSPPSSIPPTHIRQKLSGLNIARHIASSPQMACVAQDDTMDDEPEPTQEPAEEM